MEEQTVENEEKKGFFKRLKKGLSKTSDGFVRKVDRAVLGKKKIDDDLIEEIEEILISADIGVKTSYDLLEAVQEKIRRKELGDADALRDALKTEIIRIVGAKKSTLEFDKPPVVMMVVGVNGVGKTTTIGKLAMKYKSQGKNVLLAAADTFRAAAVEQLEIWSKRSDIPIIKQAHGSDPTAVAYDAIESAKAKNVDLLLIDTAGRLHTKTNLMEELKKTKRALAKVIPDAPHHVLLTLDASTGQNAISQAKLFHEAVGITGIAVTKLDGTPKGGVVIGICDEMNIPIHYIGIGEQIDDLRDFDPREFVDALF